MLEGVLPPDAGEIERAENLKIVVFEQERDTLDPTLSLKRALAPEGDAVVYQGRQVHVAGWAKRFLFRAEQLETPVGRLSGGEKARILIARLMLQPADLLILDEPTNDLDIPTLEVLEDALSEFAGGSCSTASPPRSSLSDAPTGGRPCTPITRSGRRSETPRRPRRGAPP
jgi:ATP-binding cassette subfamily F protein uup